MSRASADRGPGSATVKRRAHYAQVQREYINNGSRCAQDVISGAWQDPPTQLPMETQETFWRSLFEQPSVPDNRCPQPVGPLKWELMVPITAEDIERSVKGMKDGMRAQTAESLRT